MSMSRDGTRPLAGQMGNPDDPYGINTLGDRLTFAVSVVEAIGREIRDGQLPEWFREEWLHEELVPMLRAAITAVSAAPGRADD